MKKVGIVSCYFQHNYGSMLQAYATQMALDKIGLENETIDISGFSQEIKYAKLCYFIKASLTSDILLTKFGMAKNKFVQKFSRSDYARLSKVRHKKFADFSRKMFRLSERYSSKAALGNACAEKYDAVLVGSDQLWLPGNIAADYYTLNFVPHNVNTVAYATSFGQSELPKKTAAKAARFLQKIRHIGLREESGQVLVKKLTGRNVPVVCDPTLLFDGDEWLGIQKQEPIIKGRYILCYFLGNNPEQREFVRCLKQETNCRIVSLLHLDEYIPADEEYADEAPYDVDPADFLNLIRHAEYVCTDSFHCTVFSILYSREFFTFRRYTKATRQSTNSRLETLFNITGIKGRLHNGDDDVRSAMATKTDFAAAHKKISALRIKSYEYLYRAVLDKGDTDL